MLKQLPGSLANVRPTLKIFLFSLTRPCFTSIGRSIRIFFLASQILYSLNLIVNSPALDNKLNTIKPV